MNSRRYSARPLSVGGGGTKKLFRRGHHHCGRIGVRIFVDGAGRGRHPVDDARASRAGGPGITVVELGGNRRRHSHSLGKPIEANGTGFILKSLLDQGTVKVVMFTVGVFPSSNTGGQNGDDDRGLHLEELSMGYVWQPIKKIQRLLISINAV